MGFRTTNGQGLAAGTVAYSYAFERHGGYSRMLAKPSRLRRERR